MQESFLHYVWQFQYFSKYELRTTEGEEVQILHPGVHNTNAGPDFNQAKVRIGDVAWAGMVEIHTQSSEWNNHKHTSDKAYDNVVLHVVWQDNQPVLRNDGTTIPTVELRGRIDPALVLQYRTLVSSGFTIPCSTVFSQVTEIVKLSMLEKSLLHRIEKKAVAVLTVLEQTNRDWEETTFQLVGQCFGFKINSDPFAQLVKNLPYKILRKHANQLFQIEALLFGQAGFLEEDFPDDYHRALRKEHRILTAKYQLRGSKLKANQWRFLRLRPANFPTLRIAQFASLIARQPNLFSRIKETSDYQQLGELFNTGQSPYWQTHYRFGKEAKAHVPDLGKSSINHILINSVVPLMVLYGKQNDDLEQVQSAMSILSKIPVEENKILENWETLGWEVKNAYDSQGLIELYNSFCLPRQCLNCNIGAAILKPKGK